MKAVRHSTDWPTAGARPPVEPTTSWSGFARVALFRRLPELLTALGADADAALAAVGLARSDFADDVDLMRYSQLEKLLAECEHRTGCEHFGLLLCEASGLAELGLPGRAARCGSSVGEGLSALVRTYNLQRGAALINLVESGGFAQFVFAIAMPGSRDTRLYQQAAVAIAFNVLEELCGPDWHATNVQLAFRSPAVTRPYQRFFKAPVHFDADESAITFSSEWLQRPLPPVDRSFLRRVAVETRQARERAFENFTGLVRDMIRGQLSSGPCSIEGVSAMLGMHRRTLDRRLARCGTSYGALQRSVKHEIAVQLLRETDLSVQQVADFLRFSSAANFATAFRAWTGTSPRDFRRQAR